MIESLKNNPLLLLFLVAGFGYPLGRLKIKGLSLGVAAVLFVGLLFGAMDSNLRIPEIIQSFGLVLFIYTIGLANGPTFVSSLKEEGLKHNSLAMIVIVSGCALVLILKYLASLDTSFIAGVFAGSLTNTPALANVVEYLNEHAQAFPGGLLANDAVVAYSLTYPMGVLGPILAISLAYWFLRRSPSEAFASDPAKNVDLGVNGEHLETITIEVDCPLSQGTTFATLVQTHQWKVMPVRLSDKIFERSLYGGSDRHLTSLSSLSKPEFFQLVLALALFSILNNAKVFAGT